jgi:hypothetical protein
MLTVTREGPFWEAVEGRAPFPPAAVTLGWELVAIDPEEGTIEVAFTAGGAFLKRVDSTPDHGDAERAADLGCHGVGGRSDP